MDRNKQKGQKRNERKKTFEKTAFDGTTHKNTQHSTDIATYRLNRLRGQFSEKVILLVLLVKEISL